MTYIYSLPVSVQDHFEVIHCIFLKMTNNSKTANRRAKQIEMLGLGNSSVMYMGYL